ncbi:MAG: hypothetical protein RL318_1480, partial [Fibrobacterota bacterium]
MDHSMGPVSRVCPAKGHRLVPIAFHPGVFEHAYCPLCDQALAWLGDQAQDQYAGERHGDGWKVRRLTEGAAGCTRAEFRLHRTWLSK